MRNKAIKIIETLKSNGFQAVLAGGCVRDMLMGIEPHDYDIATNALPGTVVDLFGRTLAVGKAFGVIVILDGEDQFEVATFRNDGTYSDGRRPDSVTFTTMEEDAKRRDLTINGMFYDPIEDKTYDFVGGKDDLENKLIRLIGNPEDRLDEDLLRMMRVIRFAVRFGFTIHPDTLDAVKSHSKDILKVSAERIADELLKILRLPERRLSIGLLFETEIIDYILPEVKALEGVEQPPDYHPEGDVLKHTILALENVPDDASDTLLLGTLFHDIGKPPRFRIAERIRFDGHDEKGSRMAFDVMKRFKFPNEDTDQVVALVGNHMKFMHVKQMRISRLKRFIRLPDFEEHMALHRADCLSSHSFLDNYDFVNGLSFPPEVIRPTPFATGKDLIDMGLTPGPLFKEILTDVEDKQLEGTILDRDAALVYVKSAYIDEVVNG